MRGLMIVSRKVKNVLYNQIMIGQVIRSVDNEQSKIVKVMQMELSEKYHMYFNKSTELKCRDPKLISKNGDIVMLRRISPTIRPFEHYEVNEIVFKGGITVDPFTKERINQSTLNPV
jgi:ribosomal protein S17